MSPKVLFAPGGPGVIITTTATMLSVAPTTLSGPFLAGRDSFAVTDMPTLADMTTRTPGDRLGTHPRYVNRAIGLTLPSFFSRISLLQLERCFTPRETTPLSRF